MCPKLRFREASRRGEKPRGSRGAAGGGLQAQHPGSRPEGGQRGPCPGDDIVGEDADEGGRGHVDCGEESGQAAPGLADAAGREGLGRQAMKGDHRHALPGWSHRLRLYHRD